jgi:hypothetical protein
MYAVLLVGLNLVSFVRTGLFTFVTFKLHWLEKELHQQELDDRRYLRRGA